MAHKATRSYIEQVPGVCGGKPVIAGTRIPVWTIVGWTKMGYNPEKIQRNIYPHLSLAQIHEALDYYQQHNEEIEQQLTVNNPPNPQL